VGSTAFARLANAAALHRASRTNTDVPLEQTAMYTACSHLSSASPCNSTLLTLHESRTRLFQRQSSIASRSCCREPSKTAVMPPAMEESSRTRH
jgi:hypothetical protein